MENNENLPVQPYKLYGDIAPNIEKCLCQLLIDTSGSMNMLNSEGESLIDQQNMAIDIFLETIRKDPVLCETVELSLTEFNDKGRVVIPFSNADVASIPILKAWGSTNLAHGIMLSLENIENREKEIKDNGGTRKRTKIILLTDGEPNCIENLRDTAINQLKEKIKQKKLEFFPIYLGDQSESKNLKEKKELPAGYKFLKKHFPETALFCELDKLSWLYEWLSISLSISISSKPGEKYDISPDSEKNPFIIIND